MATDDKRPDFIDGETLKAAEIAAQLLPILAMWGIPRNTARRAAAALTTTLAGMSDAEYAQVGQGLRIKAGKPANGPETQN
jgi:hypothetical protein